MRYMWYNRYFLTWIVLRSNLFIQVFFSIGEMGTVMGLMSSLNDQSIPLVHYIIFYRTCIIMIKSMYMPALFSYFTKRKNLDVFTHLVSLIQKYFDDLL